MASPFGGSAASSAPPVPPMASTAALPFQVAPWNARPTTELVDSSCQTANPFPAASMTADVIAGGPAVTLSGSAVNTPFDRMSRRAPATPVQPRRRPLPASRVPPGPHPERRLGRDRVRGRRRADVGERGAGRALGIMVSSFWW